MSIHPIELCKHIKVSGDPCGAPALRDREFCRFHHCYRKAEVDVSTSALVPPAPFLLPVLEDAESIQFAIAQVCEHLLHRRLSEKKAGILLYAMQVALSNLGRLNGNKSQDNNQKKSSAENNQGSINGAEAPSPAPASSETASNGQDSSGSTSSTDPDRFPPGTIQASAQPRRSRSEQRVLRQ